jgi:hypothetical protein
MITNTDDTAILFSHNDTRVISEKLSRMLKSCHEWLADNKLSLHLGKTESIIDNMVTREKRVNHDTQIFNTGFGFYINPITGNTNIFRRLRTQFPVWTK